MISESKKSTISKILLFLSTILWGSSFFILKNTLDEIPVYFLLSIRFLGSAVLMSIIFFKKWKKINFKYIWTGIITGIFLAFAYIFQTVGLKYTTPGTNAFLTTVYCIIVPFMCWAVTKKKPDAYNTVAAFIAIAGIGLVCLDSTIKFSFMGEGFTLLCGVFFAAQIVAIDIWGKDLDIILYTIIQFFAAFAVCLVFFFAMGEKVPENISSQSIMSIIYVTVFATTVSFIFMNVGIKHTNAAQSALILCLESVFGVLFSIIFYHERLTLQVLSGFIIIFAALVINETKPKFLKLKK